MWIKQFSVVNVGPFAKLELILPLGSVGVFGPNGSGKSTLLNLMYGLVTNDFRRFAGTKEQMVRSVAGEDEPSGITGTLVAGTNSLTIERNFRTGKGRAGSKASLNGGTPVTDARKVQELVYDSLGIDRRLLDSYVFKEQDQICDFITSEPAARAAAYQTLCRTENCEAAYVAIGEFLGRDRELNAEVTDESDAIRAAIAEADATLARLADERAASEEDLCGPKFLKKYQSRVAAAAEREQLLSDHRDAVNRVNVTRAALRDAESAFTQRAAKLAEVRSLVDKLTDQVRESRAKRIAASGTIAAWEAYDRESKQHHAAARKLDEAVATLNNLVLPPRPDDYVSPEELSVTISKREVELADATKALEALDGGNAVACPVCGTPSSKLHSHVNQLRSIVETLPAVIKGVKKQRKESVAFDLELGAYERKRVAARATRKAAQTDLDNAPAPTKPSGDLQAAKSMIRSLEEVDTELDNARERLQKLERSARSSAIEQAKADFEVANRVAEMLKEKLDAGPIDHEKLAKAQKRLEEHRVAELHIADIEGECRAVERQRSSHVVKLAQITDRLKRGKKLQRLVRVAKLARDALHRDRLPRRVATENLVRIESRLNENLAAFGDPFWVQATDDLSFSATKPGLPPEPAAWLSTGQRVVLAMAFWPAIGSLWGGDLGLLCLDEPTANLDEYNRKCLREALEAMKERERGHRQLIMVTHDHDLRTAFDKVIEL
jgi:DNA repair exonuclease SbcCD ATPase subunit